ncbi:MAG: ABC transporter ATP-binding protein [Xanthobacteraceae bacterium]
MLEIMSLSGGWGSTTIVEDLSLTVGTGEAVAIVGRNGVGKSTLLEIITGRARRSGGTIRLANKDISHQPTKYRAKMGLGYVPQSREVFPSLTVREHIAVSARPGQWSEDRLLGLFPPLARRLHSLGGQLSGGEQQMLAIARALSANPKMLLMDEPSEGLAPVVVEQLIEAMKTMAKAGSLAILLVEQRIDLALELSTRCVVMDRGRLVHQGASIELAEDEERLGRLLGLGGNV